MQTVLLCGNTAKQCRLGLFQDSDFAGDLEDSKSTSGGRLCIFGSHTFVPISWMCQKQTSVSHSSTESEIISLDTGLKLDGIPARDLWDLIVSVLGNTNQNRKERRDLLSNKREACSPPHTIHKRMQSQRVINDLDNVDFIPSNVQSSHQEALMYVFEDNKAVIKMIIKGRSPTMRHVTRSHRVALDWLFDRINLDPKIQIKCIDTKNQLADILTKGNFTPDERNHLLCLFNISHFSSTDCSSVFEDSAVTYWVYGHRATMLHLKRNITFASASVTTKGRQNNFNALSARMLKTNQHVESFSLNSCTKRQSSFCPSSVHNYIADLNKTQIKMREGSHPGPPMLTN